jgi:hypothetical protein
MSPPIHPPVHQSSNGQVVVVIDAPVTNTFSAGKRT